MVKLFRQLKEIVPQNIWKADAAGNKANGPGSDVKFLVSCRSHFFRDQLQEQGLLSGFHREESASNPGRQAYKIFHLAPFTSEQIQSQLNKRLGTNEGRSAFEIFQKTHDLLGLASKPLLFRFIFESLDKLQAIANAGKRINTAIIYQELFGKTIQRDGEKKLLMRLPDKTKILSALALQLWQKSKSTVSVDWLDEWFEHNATENKGILVEFEQGNRDLLLTCLLYTSPSPRDRG